MRQHICCSQSDTQNTLSPPSSIVIHSAGREIFLESGEIGRQANGAVMLRSGDTMVYATACCSREATGDGSFLPLTVNYSERFSAAGRTTGSWLKREGRPKEGEVLTSRLIDRPLRPMFAPGWSNDTQVLIWVLSYDGINSPEPLAITAAAAALSISDIPLTKAVAGVRVGYLEGRGLVVGPTEQEMEESKLDLVLAGTADAVLMIEGYCDFLPEEDMLEAVRMGHQAVAEQCRAIDAWRAEIGKAKQEPKPDSTAALEAKIEALCRERMEQAYRDISGKHERAAAAIAIQKSVKEQLQQQMVALTASQNSGSQDGAEGEDEEDDEVVAVEDSSPVNLSQFGKAFKSVESRLMRDLAARENMRADGRQCDEVRPIACRAGLLPCTHGSALFTRGETQTITVTTLGSEMDAQQRDEMTEGSKDKFFLQYYFPPSSVGETGRVGAPGRREVGHGQLAQRALTPIIPDEETFPYTIRVESTVTESNGSSSMATVCGGYLALLDAGVPVTRPVAGVAMGLMLEQDGQFRILTDILGSEDAMGDMDFKVAGDADAITAFQMDIKVEGITVEILAEALKHARTARQHILGEMDRCMPAPRRALADNAPRIQLVTVDPEKVGFLIGPGGRNIRAITVESGAEQVQVVDGPAGRVEVRAPTDETLERAVQLVRDTCTTPEPGTTYRNCRIESIEKFGILVEILPGKTGLVHTSELDVDRTVSPDAFSADDRLDVKLLEVSADGGKLKLSRKAVQLDEGQEQPEVEQPEEGKIYRQASSWSSNKKCKIANKSSFGAFVEILPGVKGMVHISEMDTGRSNLEDFPDGTEIDVKLLEMSNGRIRLSRRAALLEDRAAQDTLSTSSSASDMSDVSATDSNGWTSSASSSSSAQPSSGVTGRDAAMTQDNGVREEVTAAAQGPNPGEILRHCEVKSMSSFGLFVEVAPGILGLVHNSELEVSKFGSVQDWEVGDTLDVKVISVADGKYRLSRKQALLDLGETDGPPVGHTARNCRITNVVDFGIFVRIAPGVSGLVHRSQMDIAYEPVENYFEVGERVDVEVTTVSPDGKIGVSFLDDMYDSDSEQVRVASSSAGYKG
ncbi:g11822 [Coccomyxa viridis]|uniref:polyribonucleotide nucleotidyltransferase n=1 Tax=Coccomyxa viridis TaxID=1274662 RepID=A0ABP1GEH6_9CHLO